MILILGDIHCKYSVINEQIDYAEQHFGTKISSVIQLGDFGIYDIELNKFFNSGEEKRFKRPVFFIDGNHEDFWHFKRLTKKFSSHFTHLPRGALNKIGKYNFLSLGGASYMDPINTPPGSVITKNDIHKCLTQKPENVDIIISHDCPTNVGVAGTVGFEYCGTPGFADSQEILEKLKPKIWLFAHHHKWHHYSNGTQFFGMDVAYNGLAILDNQFNIKLIKHPYKKHFEINQRFYGREDHLWPLYRTKRWVIYGIKMRKFVRSIKSKIKSYIP